MNDKTRNTLLGAAGAMLSAAAIRQGLSDAIDRNLVGEAMDRKAPRPMLRRMSRLKGYDDCPEELALFRELEARLEASPHETVQIESFDGTGLVGHLFRSEHQRRAVVAMHGWRSGWARDFGAAADFFRENNCTVLYAEQRGQGESGGDYISFGMIERYDCLEWVKWMNQNGFSDTPIYLAGISMGATTVLMTAGFAELPENVAGILADCGFTSAGAEWKHISENNLRMPFERRRKHINRLCRKRIELGAEDYTTLDAMRACRTPVLFIHGGADTFVPVEMTVENYEACAAPKKLLIVPEANHGMSYFTDREGYENAVKEFWAECERVK